VRVYDVRDLLVADAQFLNAGGDRGKTLGGGSGSGAALFSAPATAPARPFDESTERLKHIITDTISPDTWRDAGGAVGSINDFDGLFVITTTPEIQRQIADLLEMIRNRGGGVPPSAAATLGLGTR
jgi:hypothetical protein